MNVVVNITNHPSSNWSDKQKEGWDKIVDISFPSVSPDLDVDDIEYREIWINVIKDIHDVSINIQKKFPNATFYLCLQGEFSLCYKLYDYLKYFYKIVIPTTQRIVKEENGIKTSIFEFVKWRIL